MNLQDRLRNDWNLHFCIQPPAELEPAAHQHVCCGSPRSDGGAETFPSVWADVELAKVKSCRSQSFAMDARMRLDHLKSGCNSPCYATEGKLFSYSCRKEHRDPDSPEEESVLDLVELLEVDEDLEDEESWLYKSQRTQPSVASALAWCRHVLDNPSPEMEAACHLLKNKLDQRSSNYFYRCSPVRHATKKSINTNDIYDCLDDNDLSVSHDSITSSYRLQDITDVHIMACLQEASLRQDYKATPSRTSPRSPESQHRLPSTPIARQSCQNPTLARLHQQVTQFKLLKLARNQAASPGSCAPLRTSLRSLQAVRNSRSLEIEDYQPTDQSAPPPPPVTSSTRSEADWSPSLSAASPSSPACRRSARDCPPHIAAMKKLQRSHSLSPCRIPHATKGYLSLSGRVFASAERSSTPAWGRNVPSTQR